MILYFSATGNSKYVAERIAKAIDTNAVSIQDIKEKNLNEVIGVVSPAYVWGVPSILEEFFKTHKIEKADYLLFYIATYGTTTGQSFYWAQKALNDRNNISFDAIYSVKMPDTWTPIFDLTNKEKVKKINDKVEPQLDKVIESIKRGSMGNYENNRLPIIVRLFYHPYYSMLPKNKPFLLEDSCVVVAYAQRNVLLRQLK